MSTDDIKLPKGFEKELSYEERYKTLLTENEDLKDVLLTRDCYIKELKENRLTKEEFRDTLCEFPPSIAEDSGQPEWTQGEIDKIWDFITKKNKYIFTEEKKLEEMKEQNSKLKKERDDQEKLKRKYSDKLGDKNQEVWKLKETVRELIHKMEKYGNVIDLTEEIKTLKTMVKEDK